MTIKTEMHGTGGGRWTTRADAKQTSRKVRRQSERAAILASLEAYADTLVEQEQTGTLPEW